MATSDDVLEVFYSDIKQILGFVSNTKYLTFLKRGKSNTVDMQMH